MSKEHANREEFLIKTVIFYNSLYYKELARANFKVKKLLKENELAFLVKKIVNMAQKRAVH
jgi:hypothetical protein